MEKTARRQSARDKFIHTQPKLITFSPRQLVKTEYLAGGTLPLVVRPEVEKLDLSSWVRNNREFVEAELLKHGGMLFRDFEMASVEAFDEFAQSFSAEMMDYLDQHTPRTRISENIYTSTEYPPDHYVPFHSENSKNHIWPMKIWFYCLQPATEGGETPIADNRKVFSLLDPRTRERFMRKNVMYVRNFGESLGLPWQTVFQTTSRATVEEYCRQINAELEWKDGDRLRIRHVCQAVATHPQTGEIVWFNQAHLFHVASLEPAARQSLLELFKEEDLPGNAFFGDGTPIERSIIEEVKNAFHQAAVYFSWQARDVLMLDNMLVAHGRAPYGGQRKVFVAMAAPFSPPPPNLRR